MPARNHYENLVASTYSRCRLLQTRGYLKILAFTRTADIHLTSMFIFHFSQLFFVSILFSGDFGNQKDFIILFCTQRAFFSQTQVYTRFAQLAKSHDTEPRTQSRWYPKQASLSLKSLPHSRGCHAKITLVVRWLCGQNIHCSRILPTWHASLGYKLMQLWLWLESAITGQALYLRSQHLPHSRYLDEHSRSLATYNLSYSKKWSPRADLHCLLLHGNNNDLSIKTCGQL